MLKFISKNNLENNFRFFSFEIRQTTLKFPNSLYLSRLCACGILIQPKKRCLKYFFFKCIGIEMKIITEIGKLTCMVNVHSLKEHHVNKIYRECDVNLFIERLALFCKNRKILRS